MKQYRIPVNGKSYDVTVEELGGAKNAPWRLYRILPPLRLR
jgi:hypothetical protein